MSITISLTPFNATLSFRLRRKKETFGATTLDHWWMPVQSLYPTAKSEPDNFQAIVAGYWQLCKQDGSQHDAEVAESYLLARLLPMMRSIGSRRIVADARLTKSRAARAESGEVLESLLAADSLVPMSEVEFRDKTGEVLGPNGLSTEDQERYWDFSQQLFSGPLSRLADDEAGALTELRQRWLGWTKGFARHRGWENEKRILDIFSYEMRAALHRCYSAVWAGLLLPHLHSEHHLSPESAKFLEFWHLEQSRESEPGSPAYFHLFHAQSFGLHPAGSLFIQTPTGKSLIGEWIQSGGLWGSDSFGRMLRGLYLTVFHYNERLDSGRMCRPQHSRAKGLSRHPRGRHVQRKKHQSD